MGNISDKETLIPKTVISDMWKRFINFIILNEEIPDKVYLKPGLTGDYVTGTKFIDMLSRLIQYKDSPNVYINIPKGNTPVKEWDGIYREQKYTSLDQSDKYSCGSTTGANILSTWGIKTNEAEMDKYCKTGTHGTNPEDLISGVLRKLKESGFNNSRCDVYNTIDFGSDKLALNTIGKFMADPYHSVAVLINTGGKGWKKYYTGVYEHWVMPVEVNTKAQTIKVNDPARTATLNFTYEEFMTGVRMVPRKSWYVFVGRKS